MQVGYARVSRDTQDLGRQIEALEKAGCEKFYKDIISGGKTSRDDLDLMLKELKPGDIVIVQKLDRLGRSLKHLIEIVYFFRDNNIGFKSLTEAFDTTTPAGRLIFQILGAVAEFEKSIIQERTKDGLYFKRLKGVQLGRREKDYSSELGLYGLLHDHQKLSDSDIQQQTGWKKSKFYKISKMYGQRKDLPVI